MRMRAFLHDHYSAQVGESPVGHALSVIAGIVLMVIGSYLVFDLPFLPLGIVIGLLGLFAVVEGAIAHIQGPFRVTDVCDTLVSFSGGAIAITFAISVLLLVAFFGAGAVAALVDWLGN